MRKNYLGLILCSLLFLNLFFAHNVFAREISVQPLWQIRQGGQIRVFPSASKVVVSAMMQNGQTQVVLLNGNGQIEGRFSVTGEVTGVNVIEQKGEVVIGFSSLPDDPLSNRDKITGINLLISDLNGLNKKILVKNRWDFQRVLAFPIENFGDKILLLWQQPYENTSSLEMMNLNGKTIWERKFSSQPIAKPTIGVYEDKILFYPGLPVIELRNLEGEVLRKYEHFVPFTDWYRKYAQIPLSWIIRGEKIYLFDAYGIKLSIFALDGKKLDEIFLDPYLEENDPKESWQYSGLLLTSKQEIVFASKNRLVKYSSQGKRIWTYFVDGEIQASKLLPDDSILVFWRHKNESLRAGIFGESGLRSQISFPGTNKNTELLVSGDYVVIFGDGRVEGYKSSNITKLIQNSIASTTR